MTDTFPRKQRLQSQYESESCYRTIKKVEAPSLKTAYSSVSNLASECVKAWDAVFYFE